MRIMHFALSCFYIEGYRYQENMLPMIHSQNGNEVIMVASCVSFNNKGETCLVQPVEYHSKDGFDVIRVPYKKPFDIGIMRRMRLYTGVYEIIERFKPDIMFFHGCSARELSTVVKYRKKHPGVKLFIDNHADRNNSATTFFSLYFQHKLIYRPVLRRALPFTEKVLCPSIECMDFCRDIYGVPDSKLEFYPLGGTIIDEKKRMEIMERVRSKEHLTGDHIVFSHSGKMDSKKRTLEIIQAFSAVTNPRFRLWIIGVLMDDVKEKVIAAINDDNRISYLGWKNSEELTDYLCATDFYVQPGGQSATMQNAMCCGCAVMLYPYKSHGPYVDGNGFFVSTVDDMRDAFAEISNHPEMCIEMKKKSLEIASELLDYEKLADRVCQI